MNIKFIGRDMEAACCGCGEPLLISPGESVDIRAGDYMDLDGVPVPVPEGFLCSVCNRKENGDSVVSMKFHPLVCSSCGGDLGEDFILELDGYGGPKDPLCPECSEPWRNPK